MLKRREFAYHLTGIIALLASVMGAYVLSGKLFDWSVFRDTVGRFYTTVFEATVTLSFLIVVLKFGIDALFFKGSSTNRKEAKGKH